MKLSVTGDINYNPFNNILSIPIKERERAQEIIREQQNKKYPYYVEIDQDRPKRSLTANAYCWVLIGKIAEKLNTSNDEVYIEMLKQYGQREEQLVSVIFEGADMIYRATKNHCVEVGQGTVNGKTFVHFAILVGSSNYDTKQMSRLIDGIVSEAKELDIETLPPRELELLKEKWGQK